MFIELKFGALVSEMTQNIALHAADKKARHFAKVKVDKTTKPTATPSTVRLGL